MMQPNRTPAGGRVDRTRLLRFRFDGRQYAGHHGDTLASALLANGVHLVARSCKYHRPRGIVSAGGEEPNALVQVLSNGYGEPNVRATTLELVEGLETVSQNRWPSLRFDAAGLADRLSALMPAGFYYKTFMWPASMWLDYERALRRMAGLGRAPEAPDAGMYDHMHAHCDVLVVGAGPAGLAAALAAGRAGVRVILADAGTEPGGRLLAERAELGGRPALVWVGATMRELEATADVRVLARTTITGGYDHAYWIGCQASGSAADGTPIPHQRLWKIRAREVVLATGGTERPLVFPDNDRPGIMLAAAVRTYLNRYAVRAGKRAVLATTSDDGYRTALDLASAGVTVAAILDGRPAASGFLPQQARARGIEVLTGTTIAGTRGRLRVSGVTARSSDGSLREFACDLLAVSGGWLPNVQLFAHARGSLVFDERLGAHVPGDTAQAVACAGTARGALALREVLAQGWECGAAAAARCGRRVGPWTEMPSVAEPEEAAGMWRWDAPELASGRKVFVDFAADVTLADIELAAREGYDAPEHLKRYTTAGMGADQGKTGNRNVLGVLADLRAMPVAEIGTTTYRPPMQPLGFGAIAGAHVGRLSEPMRTTPLDAWQARNGAVFENVGQWRRARYYPRPGETMREAVERECRAVRAGLGIFDASTLGKIDIQGADAGEFLQRIYCTRVRSLPVGRCRYGLMLRQDGMVFDDGVVARLAQHHYVLTTTTGGAARVLAWLEEWLQTEWPELRVYCTSVSEQYAQIAVAGPRCVEMLAPLTDVELDAMPYLAVREGAVAGIPARVFRVSYSGALGYEIAAPTARAHELWTTLVGAGERFGITPYGTEAMHVLRAEMGYIAVGQDTDGSVTPIDIGFEGRLAHDERYIGKRSLDRTDARRRDRRQLVGLLTEPPRTVLEEGAQIVAEPIDARKPLDVPVPMLGHVTSSYYSPACGCSIALGLVEAGIARLGETLYAVAAGPPVRVTLTVPRFLDAREERADV